MLCEVLLSRHVLAACANHALSTEKEENMGLLLGDIVEHDTKMFSCSKSNAQGEKCYTAQIWGVSVQVRSDKRRDRVEVSPEQLSASAIEAERLGKKIKRRTRVVGWYHSHPHITVLPSHVDVRTQYNYQRMDKTFVGLILSCFNKKSQYPNAANRSQIIAFQSLDMHQNEDQIRATEEMRIIARTTGQRFQRLEIPLRVVPLSKLQTWSLSQRQELHSQTLNVMLSLPNTIFQEEKNAYQLATFGDQKNNSSSFPHPLLTQHNSSVYCRILCQLLEHGFLPLFQVLKQNHIKTLNDLQLTKKQNTVLRKQLKQTKEEQVREYNEQKNIQEQKQKRKQTSTKQQHTQVQIKDKKHDKKQVKIRKMEKRKQERKHEQRSNDLIRKSPRKKKYSAPNFKNEETNDHGGQKSPKKKRKIYDLVR